MKEVIQTIRKLINYNLKVVFGNKFIYFLSASVIFYLLITLIALFSDSKVSVADAYSQLLFPGLLIVFFPTVFGIQSDEDMRILEILFGIPNYRYKVWLVRLAIIFTMVFLLLVIFSFLSRLMLVYLPVFEMSYQLLFPVLFFGALGFLFSTLVKNGNGAAVFTVAIGLGTWFLDEFLGNSKWNVFLNPFKSPSNMSDSVWLLLISNNRLYLLIAIVGLVVWGLNNLQKRERFIR